MNRIFNQVIEKIVSYHLTHSPDDSIDRRWSGWIIEKLQITIENIKLISFLSENNKIVLINKFLIIIMNQSRFQTKWSDRMNEQLILWTDKVNE